MSYVFVRISDMPLTGPVAWGGVGWVLNPSAVLRTASPRLLYKVLPLHRGSEHPGGSSGPLAMFFLQHHLLKSVPTPLPASLPGVPGCAGRAH